MTIENPSRAEATIVVGDHQAQGTRMVAMPAKGTVNRAMGKRLRQTYAVELEVGAQRQPVSRFVEEAYTEFILYRPLALVVPKVLAPGERTLAEYLLYVDPKRYDVVRLATHVHAVRDADGLVAQLATPEGKNPSRLDAASVEATIRTAGESLEERGHRDTKSYKTFSLWTEKGTLCAKSDVEGEPTPDSVGRKPAGGSSGAMTEARGTGNTGAGTPSALATAAPGAKPTIDAPEPSPASPPELGSTLEKSSAAAGGKPTTRDDRGAKLGGNGKPGARGVRQ